jgi:hypothetical protein
VELAKVLELLFRNHAVSAPAMDVYERGEMSQ